MPCCMATSIQQLAWQSATLFSSPLPSSNYHAFIFFIFLFLFITLSHRAAPLGISVCCLMAFHLGEGFTDLGVPDKQHVSILTKPHYCLLCNQSSQAVASRNSVCNLSSAVVGISWTRYRGSGTGGKAAAVEQPSGKEQHVGERALTFLVTAGSR